MKSGKKMPPSETKISKDKFATENLSSLINLRLKPAEAKNLLKTFDFFQSHK